MVNLRTDIRPKELSVQAANSPQSVGIQAFLTAIAVAGAAAAVFAITDPRALMAIAVVCACVLGVLAAFAYWRKERLAGTVFATVGVLLFAGLFWYSSSLAKPGTAGPGTVPVMGGSSAASPSYPSSPAPAQKPKPVFQGTAKIAPGQALDIEAASPTPRQAAALVEGDDLRIDYLSSFVYDRDGYLPLYTGDINDAKAGCSDVLANRANDPRFALADYYWYCARTSEGRIALLQFGAGTTYSRVGSVNYRVWDE